MNEFGRRVPDDAQQGLVERGRMLLKRPPHQFVAEGTPVWVKLERRNQLGQNIQYGVQLKRVIDVFAVAVQQAAVMTVELIGQRAD